MRNTKVSTAGRKAREIKKEWLKKKKKKNEKVEENKRKLYHRHQGDRYIITSRWQVEVQ